MPINVKRLKFLLHQSGYPKHKIGRIIKGFTIGFDIGYNGPMDRVHEAHNIPLRIGSQVEMWNKIMKEVMKSRYAGPFQKHELPFKSYIQSPIGLVPKSNNRTRLIFHLYFDSGQEENQKSVNFHTPQHLCSVKYHDLDEAVCDGLRLLAEYDGTQLYYSKTDFSDAFRLLPVKMSQCVWLILKMRHPKTGIWCYFIDKCLPFGASISCALFQEFSDCMTNYLDDFLFAVITAFLCNRMVQIFLDLCQEINCPVAKEKTEFATQIIIFLGVLLNGRMLTLSIPEDKKLKALHLVQEAI